MFESYLHFLYGVDKEIRILESPEDRARAFEFITTTIERRKNYRIGYFIVYFASFFLAWQLSQLVDESLTDKFSWTARKYMGLIAGLLTMTLFFFGHVLLFRKSCRRELRRFLNAEKISVCVECGYSLRGQFTNCCPECGKLIGPD